MEDDYEVPKFSICPRCGDRAYDNLKSHGHCVGCQYNPTTDAEPNYAIPPWVFEQLATSGVMPDTDYFRKSIDFSEEGS